MKKRPPLTKEQIISTAIAIADDGGLNSLSMRKLAEKLNIQAMSLYYYYKTKEELIAQMADMLIVQLEAGLSENETAADWRSVMLNRAASAKSVFRKHIWLPSVIDSKIQSGNKRLQYTNDYIGTLRKIGFPIELSLKVTSLIDSYIYGFCRQLSHFSETEKSYQELAEDFSAVFTPEEYPYLNEATELVMKNGYDENTDFLFGLNIILNGIELELQALKKT